jgi:hypothetical protein
MAKTSGLLTSALLALALASVLPVAAHASLANDPSFIAEMNAAYGTHFQAQQAQAPAQK